MDLSRYLAGDSRRCFRGQTRSACKRLCARRPLLHVPAKCRRQNGRPADHYSGGLAGHYYTQTVMPEGRATGRDDLEISGNKWTFTSRRLEYGKSKYCRSIYTFADHNHIHFEQAQSADGTHWTAKASGDQVRGKTPNQ